MRLLSRTAASTSVQTAAHAGCAWFVVGGTAGGAAAVGGVAGGGGERRGRLLGARRRRGSARRPARGRLGGGGLGGGERQRRPARQRAARRRRRGSRRRARAGAAWQRRGRRVVAAAAPARRAAAARGLVVREVRGRHAQHRAAADGRPDVEGAVVVRGDDRARAALAVVARRRVGRDDDEVADAERRRGGRGRRRRSDPLRFSGWRGDDAPRGLLERERRALVRLPLDDDVVGAELHDCGPEWRTRITPGRAPSTANAPLADAALRDASRLGGRRRRRRRGLAGPAAVARDGCPHLALARRRRHRRRVVQIKGAVRALAHLFL